MKTLNEEQVSLIEERLLSKYKIKYDDFRNEIVDHIACEIEEEMNKGISFEDAYEKIRINWNPKLISADKGLFKGIPQLITNQLDTDFTKVEWKIKIISIALVFGIMYGLIHIGINLLLFYSVIPVLMVLSLLLTYLHVKDVKDYRYDYFKGKALHTLYQCILIVLYLSLFAWYWEEYNDLDVFLGGIVLYSFFMNCYLLMKFCRYSKNSRLNVSF